MYILAIYVSFNEEQFAVNFSLKSLLLITSLVLDKLPSFAYKSGMIIKYSGLSIVLSNLLVEFSVLLLLS